MLVEHVGRTCLSNMYVWVYRLFCNRNLRGDGIYASRVRMMLDDLRGFSKKPENVQRKRWSHRRNQKQSCGTVSSAQEEDEARRGANLDVWEGG